MHRELQKNTCSDSRVKKIILRNTLDADAKAANVKTSKDQQFPIHHSYHGLSIKRGEV